MKGIDLYIEIEQVHLKRLNIILSRQARPT